MILGQKIIPFNMKSRLFLRSLLALAAGMALTIFLFHKVEIRSFRELVGQASRSLLLLSAVALCCFYMVRAFRWTLILRWRVSPPSLFVYSSISYLISSVLPPQIGELVRPGFLRTRHGIPYFFALASVGVERLLDIASLFLLAVAGLVLMHTRPAGADWLVSALRTAGIIVAASLLILVTIVFRSATFLKGVYRCLSFLRLPHKIAEAVGGTLKSVLDGATVITSPFYLFVAMTCSVVLWSMNAVSVVLVFRALRVDFHVGAVILGFAVISLGLVFPLTPAYIGQYEAIWVLVFLALGMGPRAQVLAAGLLSHIIIIAMIVFLGLLSMGILGLSNTIEEDGPNNELGLTGVWSLGRSVTQLPRKP